jgi:5-methylcytosine-specific restriction endonuclease McrA
MTYNRTRRRTFTDLQRVRFFEERHGICALCGQKIDGVRERWEIDHAFARELGGGEDDDNLALVHEACHRIKTAHDRQAIAKSNRVQARHIGAHRAQRPMPGSRASGIKVRMDGTRINRSTGEPI